MPVAVGVPLMVMVLLAKAALTPAGKPLEPETPAFNIPVAPIVAIVLFVAVFTISVRFVNAAVFRMQGVTVVVVVTGGETPAALSAITEKV